MTWEEEKEEVRRGREEATRPEELGGWEDTWGQKGGPERETDRAFVVRMEIKVEGLWYLKRNTDDVRRMLSFLSNFPVFHWLASADDADLLGQPRLPMLEVRDAKALREQGQWDMMACDMLAGLVEAEAEARHLGSTPLARSYLLCKAIILDPERRKTATRYGPLTAWPECLASGWESLSEEEQAIVEAGRMRKRRLLAKLLKEELAVPCPPGAGMGAGPEAREDEAADAPTEVRPAPPATPPTGKGRRGRPQGSDAKGDAKISGRWQGYRREHPSATYAEGAREMRMTVKELQAAIERARHRE